MGKDIVRTDRYVQSDYSKGKLNLLKMQRALLIKAITKSNWNVKKAQQLNGADYMGTVGYRRMLQRHGIDYKDKVIKAIPCD